MPGDNFKVEIHSCGREHFNTAIRLAFTNAPGGRATHVISPIPTRSCQHCLAGKKGHWIMNENGNKTYCHEIICTICNGTGTRQTEAGIVLLWHEGTIGNVKATPLPFPLTADAAVEFVWAYLEQAAGDFGPPPDHDGDSEKGFIITTGDIWGHVEGCSYAFLVVYLNWQMYGK